MHESEKGVLSCILQDNSLIYKAVQFLNVDDFIYYKNKEIFLTLKREIIENKKKIDVMILAELVKKNISQLYLTEILDISPSSTLLPQYITEVKKAITKKRIQNLITECSDIDKGIFEEKVNAIENKFKNIIINYRENKFKNDIYNPQVYAKQLYDKYLEYKHNPNLSYGIKTGFDKFDSIARGLKTLNIISAPTGTGKTTLALNWACNIAIEQNIPVLYINYEMSGQELADRIVSSISKIKSDDLKNGVFQNDDLASCLSTISQKNTLFFTDNLPKTINETISFIYQYVNKYKIKVVFVDYIGEIAPDNQAIQEKSEYFTYGRYTQLLKQVCSELNISCVLLAQIGREGDENPKRANLQGSWKIIQKADIFLILFYDKEQDCYCLKIEKQRHGKCYDKIKLYFSAHTHTFTEIPF